MITNKKADQNTFEQHKIVTYSSNSQVLKMNSFDFAVDYDVDTDVANPGI
jgi:hypothetical protein